MRSPVLDSAGDPTIPFRPSHRHPLLITLLGLASMLCAGCHRGGGLPAPDSKLYADFVSAFYTGLAALEVGDDVRAEAQLSQATQLVPGEPASWADWGILALRQRNFDTAAQRLERARTLVPDNGHIYYLLGLLESTRGNSPAAIVDLRQSVKLEPNNLRAIYQLASEVERQGDQNSAGDFQQRMGQILALQPDNVAALLELSRISAKRGDTATLHSTVARIVALSTGWPPDVKEQLASLETAASSQEPRSAATRSIFLRNVLMQLPGFRANLSEIKPLPGGEAEPFTHFLRLETPAFRPAPSDTAINFVPGDLSTLESGAPWNWIGAISLSGEGVPAIAVANGRQLRLSTGVVVPFPGGASSLAPSPEGVLPIDFNYDFKMDLILAGAGGIHFLRQDSPVVFTDVTAQSKLPKSITSGPVTGAWAVDIEADGDLDIVLGAKSGLPVVLRNNGDGTFLPVHPFAGISGLRQLVWVDLNEDGNPDAALIDGDGRLHLFMNDRSGKFDEIGLPAGFRSVEAIAAGDVSGTGALDLLVLDTDGAITRLSAPKNGKGWRSAVIARVPNSRGALAGEVRLRAADVDNNGALDLLVVPVGPSAGSVSGARLWLHDRATSENNSGDGGQFTLMPKAVGPALVFDAADLKGEGRLDLLGLSPDGRPVVAANQGTRNYHWQTIRPRARQATGDQRINSFGIGGEIEIRSGLLVQKQAIIGPQLHFGLGEQMGADVARIIWPNGSVRAEFGLKANQQIVTEQRLKGSCPFLFAYNGRQMEFVKDAVPWGAAIGLHIDALGPSRIEATEEWYKIGRDQLVPHNGYYDLRVTGELWEAYYYDYLSLMTVDHPAGTEIFTDERFSVPAVKLAITAVAPPQPIARAVDDNGNDVTSLLSALDGKYLDTFGRGQYQGITRDHFVEIDLGTAVPQSGPLWLIARGWLHPSDSSVNLAMSQGTHPAPRGLSLEVPDGRGGWRTARPNLGFPAGRKKICLIDLTNVFLPGTPRRLRLRTNLEIYWDSIEWARGMPQAPLKIEHLAPAAADLHYRGYSVVDQANASSPEIPEYNRLASSTQVWRDLSGYYTRFGDVRELLARTDDRYVIMNAGDEMSLRFPAPAPPPAGWVRDYVLAGDGWIKDGDYNSTYSQTVLPYPYHARKVYDSPPGTLEEEWVYKHHPEDWQKYQTRYITPQDFEDALRSHTGQ